MDGHLLERLNLLRIHNSIGLGNHDEEIEQLQALLIHHVGTYLVAAVLYHRTVLLHAHLLLLLEELEENFFALLSGCLAEILTQEAAHHLHLRMHNLAICIDDVGTEHQQREHEGVSLSLVALLAAVALVAEALTAVVLLAAVLLAAVGIVGVVVMVVAVAVYRIQSVIKERTEGITCQGSQRTGCDEAEHTTYPFTCCHFLVVEIVEERSDA